MFVSSPKPVHVVAFEAVVVGLLLVLFVNMLSRVVPTSLGDNYEFAVLVAAGAIFHIVFEYFGWNKAYCKAYMESV